MPPGYSARRVADSTLDLVGTMLTVDSRDSNVAVALNELFGLNQREVIDVWRRAA